MFPCLSAPYPDMVIALEICSIILPIMWHFLTNSVIDERFVRKNKKNGAGSI